MAVIMEKQISTGMEEFGQRGVSSGVGLNVNGNLELNNEKMESAMPRRDALGSSRAWTWIWGTDSGGILCMTVTI